MVPFRHFFDASATRSADLPGAIIDHSLRDPSLWTNCRQTKLGCMLPVVALTTMNLKAIQARKTLSFYKPLLDALLGGIQRRFDHLLEDHEYLMASGFHPRFR